MYLWKIKKALLLCAINLLCSCESTRKSKLNSIQWAKACYITIAVTIALRIHLFSFRTQKLSSIALKVLGRGRLGRIRSRRIYAPIAQQVEHAAVNRSVIGSSPVWGAKKLRQHSLAEFFHTLFKGTAKLPYFVLLSFQLVKRMKK